MMTKEGSTKNCKFHDPRSWGSSARAWPYQSYSKNVLYFVLLIYSTLIAIVLRDYNAAFLCHCRISFIL